MLTLGHAEVGPHDKYKLVLFMAFRREGADRSLILIFVFRVGEI